MKRPTIRLSPGALITCAALFAVILSVNISRRAVSTAEVHQIVATTYYNTFSRAHPALKRVRPGDTVVTKTIDAGGQDEKDVRRGQPSNPLTGPFYIEGAEPVEGLYPNRYKDDLVRPGRSNLIPWELDLERQTVRLKEPASNLIKLEFPAKPMLGCVGVAPAGDFAPTSGPSGNYGGNLDYNEIGEGSVVMLPVYHPGALLFIGDGHALQADGEPTGTGIETSMDVEFTVDVRKKVNLTGPRVETGEYIISVGSQPEFVSSLDRALKLATSDMVNWLVADYKLEPWAAHLLIGYQGKYDVVTVAGSMALKVPKKYLPPRR